MIEMASIPRAELEALKDRLAELEREASSRNAQLERQVLTLRGIVDSSGAPIFSVDRGYRYTSFNQSHAATMAALYGVDIAIGRSLLECMTVPGDRAVAQRNLDRALAGETLTEESFSGEDARTRSYFRVSHNPIRDAEGEVVGVAVLVQDLTDRRRAEDKLKAYLTFLEGMDRVNRAIQGASDLEAMMSDVLDVVLDLLGCDRAFLVYPCDPDAATWRAPMERTRPEYPGVLALGLDVPMDADVAATLRILLEADGPVKFGPGTERAQPPGVSEQFGIKSFVSTAIRPRVGKPWQFGVHQCSHARTWTPEEERLLTEVGRRLADGLTSLLIQRDMRRLNRQLRAISNCNQTLLRASDEHDLLREVCQIVVEQMGYRMAGVAYIEGDAAGVVRLAASAGADEVTRLWADTDGENSPLRTVARAGATVTIQDLSEHPALTPWREAGGKDGCRAAIWLPLKDERQVVFGVFLVGSSEVNAFSAQEVELLEELAGDMAFGVVVLRARAQRKESARSIALLSFALNNVKESAFLVDEHGVFHYVNDAACRLLGYERGELLGGRVPDIDPDFPPERWPSHWEQLQARRALVFDGRHRTKDGRLIPVEVSANYFEYEGRGYILALAHDVTDRHRLEEQLRQAQKMEAIGTLAGGVAHDFNNLLTGIIGYGSLMQLGMRPEDPNWQPVQEILAASDRAAQLTRGLLAFSRKQVMNPKTIDLNDVVRNVERLLRRLIGEDIELSTTLAPRDLLVTADAGQIEQVLMNLATNARDAMPNGGHLSITTRRRQIGEDLIGSHGFGKPGTYAQIAVSDTGLGMDEQTRQKVFEPFFTTKEIGKGTGLGLAIVYGIIKQHGGTIDVYSEPGRGTTFKILLPLSAAAPDEQAPKALAPPARGTETILLAEDDATVRMLIASVLRGHGYQVIVAADGADALEQWAAHRDAVDILILDVVMPRKSGRDVYDAVRSERSDIRVLFLSGYTADIIHKKGIFEEGLELLSKPLSPFDLLRKVRAILDGKT